MVLIQPADNLEIRSEPSLVLRPGHAEELEQKVQYILSRVGHLSVFCAIALIAVTAYGENSANFRAIQFIVYMLQQWDGAKRKERF